MTKLKFLPSYFDSNVRSLRKKLVQYISSSKYNTNFDALTNKQQYLYDQIDSTVLPNFAYIYIYMNTYKNYQQNFHF